MELVKINKSDKNHAEIILKIADIKRNYSFSYSQNDIFTVDFPEDLRRLLRFLPASVTHSLVEKIEEYLTTEIDVLPFDLEIEKEILQMV